MIVFSKNKPNSPKVLVVEDSQAFGTMLKESIMGELGYGVDLAQSAAEAMALICEPEHNYFAAVVDLHLPDAANGEAAHAVVKADIPTIVFTGSDNITPEKLWDIGIADYVHKNTPFCVPYLLHALTRLHNNADIGVLVVDDVASARQLVAAPLRAQRFQVFEAASAEDARATFEAHPHIKIIFIDHFMPGTDGLSLAGELHISYTPDKLDIIGMSGKDLAVSFLKAGAIDFLHKPFSTEELLCRVNHSADRLESYDRLKALNSLKNRFLGVAAHDIRNPIAAVKTTARLLKRPKLDESRRQSIAQIIENNCTDVLELLENLLDVSAIESGHIELNTSTVNINDVVQERAAILHMIADEKGVALNLHLEGDVEHPLDKMKFSQVIDNLLSNAIKFSPADSEVEVKCITDEKGLRLQVIDAGPGIAENEQEQLFQPFQKLSSQTTQGEKQTGLGLSIAKSVVEAHNGEIFFKRTACGLSRFVVHVAFA